MIRRPSRSRIAGLLVLAVALTVSSGCVYFNTFYHARKFYDQAQKIEEDARKSSANTSGSSASRNADAYNKCIEKCEKVIDEHPGSRWADDAYLLMAKAYYGKGDYVGAARELQRLREKLPNSKLVPEASYWMGLVAYADGDYETATNEWTQLLERFPKYDGREDVEFQLAETLRQQRRYDEAAKAYTDFVARFPKGKRATDARVSLGRMLIETKQYDEAQEIFATVARTASDETARREARLLLGDAYDLGGEREDALETLTELAFDLDPRYLEGRMTPEKREEIQRQQEEAIAKAREAARADSASVRRSPYNYNDPRRSDTADPNYDVAFDPKDPNYDPYADPGNPKYDPRRDPTSARYDARFDPDSPSYDEQLAKANPYNATGQNVNGQYAAGQNTGGQVVDPNNPYGAQNTNNQFGNQNPDDPFGSTLNGNTTGSPYGQTQTGGYQQNPNQQNPLGQTGTLPNAALPSQAGPRLAQNDPAYRELAKVLLREGRVLAGMGKPWEAILAYEQVIAEYPRTEFAAEAQYRIGYTQEVDLDDYDAAEEAYGKVASQGQSTFIEEAQRRAKNLATAKRLSAALSDSANVAAQAAADARFVRAELYLFQQDKPERAVEEYETIQTELAGTEYAAKAALAEAYVRFSVMADTARGRAKYAEVMKLYGDTEYGYQARRVLRGPEKEPEEKAFMGPRLDDLLTEQNLTSLAAKDSTLRAAMNPPPADSLGAAPGMVAAGPGANVPRGPGGPKVGGALPGGGPGGPGGPPPGVVPGGPPGAGNPGAEPGMGPATVVDEDEVTAYRLPSDPLAVPEDGPSPILNEKQREARRASTPPPGVSGGGDAIAGSVPDSLTPAVADTVDVPEAARGLAEIKRQAKSLTPEQVRAMMDSLNAVTKAARAAEDSAAAADSAAAPAPAPAKERPKVPAPADTTKAAPADTTKKDEPR